MSLTNVPNGIEICLKNGKRLFDDAEFLQQQERYSTAIPLYIFAYEEFGKAKFMCDRLFRGQTISESQFEKLTDSGAAHSRKILIDPLDFANVIKNDSDEKLSARNKFAKDTGLPFIQLDRVKALKLHNNTMKIFGRLHDLKMRFLYVDYDNGVWRTGQFIVPTLLKDVCAYLNPEIIRVYHEVNLNLFLMANRISANMVNLTEEQTRIVTDNPNRIALSKLDQLYRTTDFKKSLEVVKTVLDNFV